MTLSNSTIPTLISLMVNIGHIVIVNCIDMIKKIIDKNLKGKNSMATSSLHETTHEKRTKYKCEGRNH